MRRNAVRFIVGALTALALLAALAVVALRLTETVETKGVAALSQPRQPQAIIPEADPSSAGPVEALPREESYAQELFEGAVDALSNRLSGVSGSLTGVAPDAADEAAPVLSADLRPHPKPLSLQPLEGVSRILVEKSKRRLTVYVGDQVARIWPIALGRDPVGDKTREGDNRTPEGIFRVDRLNGASAYHLSLGLDYPQPKHRAQARALGVSPGGDIMIHGQPNRSPFGKLPGDWTAGCIALSDAEVTQLFAATAVGTVVEIRP